MFRNVGAAVARSRHLSQLAQHDPLTSLPNRLLLMDRLIETIALARRRKTTAAVLFIDVDGFKAINDAHGHAHGDAILGEVARRLRSTVRTSDTVARVGGDEFVVVLADIEQPGDGVTVARKLLASAAAPGPDAPRQPGALHVSIGVAVYPDHVEDATVLLQRADEAMYTAKRAGGGAVASWEPRP